MNSRVYLFSTAINELKISPIFGNGPLHYQQKYEGTFPHNLVFELMADFGIVGVVIVFLIVAYIYLSALRNAFKTKNRELGMLLTMLTMYIPMYLAYTSFYSNGFFIFTICILLFCRIKRKKVE
jgi:O-antigen ligase